LERKVKDLDIDEEENEIKYKISENAKNCDKESRIKKKPYVILIGDQSLRMLMKTTLYSLVIR
jgi:hypothetical protein